MWTGRRRCGQGRTDAWQGLQLVLGGGSQPDARASIGGGPSSGGRRRWRLPDDTDPYLFPVNEDTGEVDRFQVCLWPCASRRRDRVDDAGVCWQGEHSWGCDRSGDVDDDIVGVIPCGCGRVRGRACLDGRGASFCSLGGRLGEGLGVLACRCVPPHPHSRNQDDHEDQRGHGRPSGQETGDARLGGFILVRQGAVIHGFCQRRHAPMSQPS